MLDDLLTEQHNPRTAGLDALPLEEALRRINDEDALTAAAVREAIPAIARAVPIIETALRAGGRLIYVGAGTSGRLGCLDAAEIPPTFGADPGLVLGLIAGGEPALRQSVEGAEDDPAAGAAALQAIRLRPADVVCGIAASGRTPFVIGALEYARSQGCATLGVANTRPAAMGPHCDVVIAPLVGPEVIAGSTRLKAGTAQKLVLNMLTTMTMVRLGKTFGNLMVDLRPTNEKLRRRALRLVRQVAEVNEATAAGLLAEAGGETKTAIMMALADCGPEEARRRLEVAGGVLRRALETARGQG
jgi:N-acetylmuramic acid 6-phosphate etherase